MSGDMNAKSASGQEPPGLHNVLVRVLLADTSELLYQQLTAMLSDTNCQLMHAVDGFEVLCRLPEWRPDVLLMASDLPRLSGIQVCHLLRQSPGFSEFPVLMLTGPNALVDQVRAELSGATSCLEKPFCRRDLENAFSAVCGLQVKAGQQGSARASEHVLSADY